MFTDVTFVWYRYFQNFIAFFIIISCVGIALETLSVVAERHHQLMKTVEIVTLGVFIIEYIGNVYFAKQRL